MTESPLQGLVIRTAVVVRPDVGYIYACDQKREEAWIPHTVTFRWMAGVFERGACNYDAHTACVIRQPEPGLVHASEPGYYTILSKSGTRSGDIFRDSKPATPPKVQRGVRSVAAIEGRAYAVGLSGMVYRLEAVAYWSRIDTGISGNVDLHAIHGFNATNLYAVGSHGEVWHHNGKAWTKRDMPTNLNLTTVTCADDGMVYIAGHDGVLIRGRDDVWEVIEHEDTADDIWDLEWFEGQLYVATMEGVYRLQKDRLVAIDFGDDIPRSSYQLSAANGVMWSIGEFDIMSYNGTRWVRIV